MPRRVDRCCKVTSCVRVAWYICSVQKLQAAVKGVEQEYADLLTETGRCAPPGGLEVLKVTRLHSALEELMDIATYTLGAAQHGTPLPSEVQGHPFKDVSALCQELEKTKTEYFAEAYRFHRKRPSEQKAGSNLAPRARTKSENRHSLKPPKIKDIVQHREPNGLILKVVGVNLSFASGPVSMQMSSLYACSAAYDANVARVYFKAGPGAEVAVFPGWVA